VSWWSERGKRLGLGFARIAQFTEGGRHGLLRR
jgi:hypothetical protein